VTDIFTNLMNSRQQPCGRVNLADKGICARLQDGSARLRPAAEDDDDDARADPLQRV